MGDYQRKVMLNKEDDEAREIQRRKDKRKKRKIQKSILEIERHHLNESENEEEEVEEQT